jgi:ABC-type sugar transport system ATPase subunit
LIAGGSYTFLQEKVIRKTNRKKEDGLAIIFITHRKIQLPQAADKYTKSVFM